MANESMRDLLIEFFEMNNIEMSEAYFEMMTMIIIMSKKSWNEKR